MKLFYSLLSLEQTRNGFHVGNSDFAAAFTTNRLPKSQIDKTEAPFGSGKKAMVMR
jgi:hypothetical protein